MPTYREPEIVYVKRPVYEKIEHVDYENRFIEFCKNDLTRTFKVKKKMYPCDLVIETKGARTIIGFIEFKRRIGALNYPKGVMLSLEKYSRLISFKACTRVPVYFVIEHAEGEYYSTTLADSGYGVTMGGRFDRGDDADVEPVILIPKESFALLKKDSP